MPVSPRLRFDARHAPRPTDAAPRALRRAMRTGDIRFLAPHPRFDQRLLLARTPGGPSAWVLTPVRGTRRRQWRETLVVARPGPPPPFPANPYRPAKALQNALATMLPLLPGQVRRQQALADLLRRAHGAFRLEWDADLHIRRGRGFARVVSLPFAGQMRISVDDHSPGLWIEGPAIEITTPRTIAHFLFPVLAASSASSQPAVDATGPRPTAHDRIAARVFLEETFGPLARPHCTTATVRTS